MANENTGIRGIAHLQIFGADGVLKYEDTNCNLITDAGDQYYAERAADGVAGNTDNPTPVTGMKLGTGTTDVAKNGAGAALGATYLSGSNVTFDSAVTSSAGSGYKVRYVGTWGAGVANSSAITEAAVVNDAASDATSTEGNTIARVEFTAVNKGANDTLVINWDHVFYDNPA